MPIDLRNPSAIPPRLISDLKSFNSRPAREEFLDPLLEDSRFLAIARELNDLCEREGVVGFHFTRSFSEKIKSEVCARQLVLNDERPFFMNMAHDLPPIR